jgi:hypothetical protein
MSQEQAWTLEEMARAIQNERLVEAEHARLVRTVRSSKQSPKVVLANALRSLATFLDGEVQTQTAPNRRLARAS